MKIVTNPYDSKSEVRLDTSIYVESPDELTEVKTMIDTFIYHSVNEEMETKIVVFYKDIKIQIDTYCSEEEFTYFNLITPLIDINLDKKFYH